jgi:hypothetical protein
VRSIASLVAVTCTSTVRVSYRREMAYVVLCGPFQGPPDLVVGPFDSHEDAVQYAMAQPGDQAGRYAVVVLLTSPES